MITTSLMKISPKVILLNRLRQMSWHVIRLKKKTKKKSPRLCLTPQPQPQTPHFVQLPVTSWKRSRSLPLMSAPFWQKIYLGWYRVNVTVVLWAALMPNIRGIHYGSCLKCSWLVSLSDERRFLNHRMTEAWREVLLRKQNTLQQNDDSMI